MHTVFANGAKIPAIGFGTYGMAERGCRSQPASRAAIGCFDRL
jgi:diketogulonate reductase-like aldo/keto reductase